MPLINVSLFSIVLCLATLSGLASSEECVFNEQFIAFSAANYCVENSPEKTFILLDGTDGFEDGSREWVKENIFNKRTIYWENQGAEISIALLGKKSVASMDMIRICTPKPESKISNIWDAPAKIKKDNALVYCALKAKADEFLSNTEGADKSLLVESITEIFRNSRYRFNISDRPNSTRKFYFVSDLFQNSRNISFHKLCKVSGASDMLTCPSYESLISDDEKVKRYLSVAIPVLNKTDMIYIYNTNVENRIDQSAREFWEQYFVAAGASLSNIFYRVELDG